MIKVLGRSRKAYSGMHRKMGMAKGDSGESIRNYDIQ